VVYGSHVTRLCADVSHVQISALFKMLLCAASYCGRIDEPLANGMIKYTNESTAVSALAVYTCADGYILSVMGVRVCQPDGRWSNAGNLPQCLRRLLPMFTYSKFVQPCNVICPHRLATDRWP
jgi:hypothetical protein